MVPDTVLPIVEPDPLHLKWSRSLSLSARILAVNLFALVPVAGGVMFLDAYRERLVEERRQSALANVQLVARSLPLLKPNQQRAYIVTFGKQTNSRIRVYVTSGTKVLDSFANTKPEYKFLDLEKIGFKDRFALALDHGFDKIVGAPALALFVEPKHDIASAWGEFAKMREGKSSAMVRAAPDGGHFISAAAHSNLNVDILLTSHAPDILGFVRTERFRVAMFLLAALSISVLLSLFLARTIAKPLRHLARAAVKVRLGRDTDDAIPRLPSRRDEIGTLARALSDMSIALGRRINATEAFAADVAHEIKNPLASLRSALEGMENAKTPEIQAQLLDIAKADVRRLDRMISDISDASRVDAQLAKANFERIDLGAMIDQLTSARIEHNGELLQYYQGSEAPMLVMGEDMRLERVLTNLIDNALSFSPAGEPVQIVGDRIMDYVVVRIMDSGPGVPVEQREAIFNRFYSNRPENEGFGQHSGLGLAIARNILEGHNGRIEAIDRPDGKPGACFELSLPAAEHGK
jgi:two-component system, OmpR family, sensor histidine kinase ChvG